MGNIGVRGRGRTERKAGVGEEGGSGRGMNKKGKKEGRGEVGN